MNQVLDYVRVPLPAEGGVNPLTDAVSAELCRSRYAALEPCAPVRSSRLAGVAVGSVNIVRFDGWGISRCDRRPDHIRQDQGDHFVLCLPLSAQIGMRHDGLETVLAPGQFIVVSTLRPIQGAMTGIGASRHASLFVRVPGPLLRQQVGNIDDYCNQPLALESGAGAIMRTLFQSALREARSLSDEASGRLATALVDMTAAAILSQIGQPRIGCRPARRSSAALTLERARLYIEAQLSDPGLNAARVAAHCRVSPRYLHALFAPGGITLAALIRERRLLQCQAALRNPQLRHRSITEIAGQWGFDDPAHFSRAYRRHFGCSPSQERRAGLRTWSGSQASDRSRAARAIS